MKLVFVLIVIILIKISSAEEEAATEKAATEEAATEEAVPEEEAAGEAAEEEAATEEAATEEEAAGEVATEEAATEEAVPEEEAATKEAATEEAVPEEAVPKEEAAAGEEAAACISKKKHRKYKLWNYMAEKTLDILCKLLNAFIPERTKLCKQRVTAVVAKIGLYKPFLIGNAPNAEVKKKFSNMVDTCNKKKNWFSKLVFFPCMVKAMDKNCPDIADKYRAEVRKLGYHV